VKFTAVTFELTFDHNSPPIALESQSNLV